MCNCIVGCNDVQQCAVGWNHVRFCDGLKRCIALSDGVALGGALWEEMLFWLFVVCL